MVFGSAYRRYLVVPLIMRNIQAGGGYNWWDVVDDKEMKEQGL